MAKVERDGAGIAFVLGQKRQTAATAWYRGETCNFNPAVANMRRHDAIERYILDGWLPPEPFINKDTRITAIGSCFAQNISDYLRSRCFTVLTRGESRAHLVTIGEGLVNSYALLQQFEWAWEGKAPEGQLWYGWNAEEYGTDEGTRLATREIFDNTDLFVITLGLSEVWYDAPTGEVFWRAVPLDRFDAERHRFRVTTVDENKANLAKIVALIRRRRPQASIVFTLSPIPLVATFRPVACLSANSISKAVLRAALDEMLREHAGPGLYYWPAYEIVQEAFGAGKWWDDRRHVAPAVITHVMRLFEAHYCDGVSSTISLIRSLAEARTAVGELAAADLAAAVGGDLEAGLAAAARHVSADDGETAELLLMLLEEASGGSERLAEALRQVREAPASELSDRRLLVKEIDARFAG